MKMLFDRVSSNGRVHSLNHKPALLMSLAEREAREYLRINAGNISYAQFEYEPVTRPVPAIERAYPGDIMPADTSCAPSYWNPVDYGNVQVTRLAPRCKRVTYGTDALRTAMQAKVRALMARRSDARRAEWAALQSAMVNAGA